jgi:hypothetical protein
MWRRWLLRQIRLKSHLSAQELGKSMSPPPSGAIVAALYRLRVVAAATAPAPSTSTKVVSAQRRFFSVSDRTGAATGLGDGGKGLRMMDFGGAGTSGGGTGC